MMLIWLLLLLRADPLRVMRAMRFATRFNFAPDPAILAAASSDEVSLADFQLERCVTRGKFWQLHRSVVLHMPWSGTAMLCHRWFRYTEIPRAAADTLIARIVCCLHTVLAYVVLSP
jgi:hypothetical protein